MIEEEDITRYEDKMIFELIRTKLGRYLKNQGLRFNRDARNCEEEYLKNKSILDIFEEYYNNYKILCSSYKGSFYFMILNKSKYNIDLWKKINKDFSNWNDEDYMKEIYSAIYCSNDGLNGFTTTEIIFNIIRTCNSL